MTIWQQVTVEGSLAALRGFVAGFEAVTGAGAVLGADLEIEAATLPAWIKRLLERDEHHLLLAPLPQADDLVRALVAHGSAAGLQVASRARVLAAAFDFEAELFNEGLARELKTRVLTSLPDGVALSVVQEREEREPDAGAPGLYDPSHGYVYQASGSIHGPLPGVLEMRRRTVENEFVTAGPLKLELEEIELR
jgi:hypothetical protein